MKRALITGITGQDGSYLAEFLLHKGYQVHGLVRRASTFNRERIDHLREDPRYQGRYLLHYGDLSDSDSLHRAMAAAQPDEVYNLAAQSHVGISFQQPTYTADVVALGTLRLLEALRQEAPRARFYQASSSELFGQAVEVPQNEHTPFQPCSPYAVAKLFAFWATINSRQANGIYAVNGILFNHESPRRGENFVTRKISRGVAEIVAGRRASFALGNLNARRDWGFAGDYVEAMWLMLQQREPEDLVIGTGETHSVREFAEVAFAAVGITLRWQGSGLGERGFDAHSGRTLITIDPAYLRPAEVNHLQADSRRARERLGWRPRVTFAELVRMMVRHDLQALGVGDALLEAAGS